MARYRVPRLERLSSVLVPTNPAPTRLGAVLLVWHWWEDARSRCPNCGALALTTGFGGMFTIGHMSGVCLGCAHIVGRDTGGFHVGHRAVQRALEGTGYTWPIRWVSSWWMKGRATALVAALQEVGAEGLPRAWWARV